MAQPVLSVDYGPLPPSFIDPFLGKIEARNDLLNQQRGHAHTKLPPHTASDQFGGRAPAIPHDADLDAIARIAIDTPTPPCVEALDNLEPLLISQLVMDSHHHGKFLLVKMVGVVIVGLTSAHAGGEDSTGDVERLKLSFVCMNQGIGHVWPKPGHWFIIKEPHLTIDEVMRISCICIVHHSDLLNAQHLPNALLARPVFSGVRSSKHTVTPLQCKEASNASLKHDDLHASLASYTEGLQMAHVKLGLGQFEGAVSDATASLTHMSDDRSKELNVKAYLRACKASYKLKLYSKAADFCQHLLDLHPGHEEGVRLVTNIRQRVKEQDYGQYNIPLLQKRFSLESPRVDAADFVLNTEVKMSGPARGRGLFATKALKAGELILAETPFFSVWAHDKEHFIAAKWNARFPGAITVSVFGLWKSVLNHVRNNPTYGPKLLDLHGDYKTIGKDVLDIDGASVVDTYQVHDIVIRNAFGIHEGKVKGKDQCSGVYIRSSYPNHSCLPNADRNFVGDLLLLYATKPIAKGEEITICYVPMSQQYILRRTNMQKIWNFQCDCRLCIAEAKVSAGVLAERLRLSEEAEAFVERWVPHQTSDSSTIHEAERLARGIAATYDNDLYADLPRIALVPIQSWLLGTTDTNVKLASTNQAIKNLAHTLGYKTVMAGGTIRSMTPTTSSVLPKGAHVLWQPALLMSADQRLYGSKEAADHWEDVTRTLDRIFFCSDDMTTNTLRTHYDRVGSYWSNLAAVAARLAGLSIELIAIC